MGNVIGIVQARMGSTRLPGKSLAPLLGRPMLQVLIERILPAQRVDRWIIATTQLPADDRIEALARQLRVECFRGSENDCLDRYYQAARQAHAGTVVRLTGDNPLLDASFVDWSAEQFLQSDPPVDYAESSTSKTFPLGLSLEVISFAALEAAWKEDSSPDSREHVCPYIYQHPERFRLVKLSGPYDYSHMRWTVDTDADLQFVSTVFESFGRTDFSWLEAASKIEQHPEWMDINRHVAQRTF
jgi:spore coat polysaccharide biosynthesis protein SpsF (cytidylyltransferase family)